MIKIFLRWYYRKFPTYRRVRLKLFSYGEADELFKQQGNVKFPWRIAKEEDFNQVGYHVWLEKVERVTE